MVHGGQQPIVGANVYLYQVGTTGYGGNGVVATSYNASVSLLNGGSVTTAGDGSFSISGQYTCTAGTQLYIYVSGGDPGSGSNNSAIGLLAGLGQCPASQTLADTVPYIWVNEVTTVTTAYALAGYATDATHIGSDAGVSTNMTKAVAAAGIANAMATVANITNIATGTALANTAANSNGVVPRTTINSLANILAACVNTTGPSSTQCSTLFSSIRSAGATGTAPTDTATAAIYIAQNPGTNVSSLFALQTGLASPFSPALTTAPKDFLLPVVYTSANYASGGGFAIDASGNIWSSNYGASKLNEFNPLGAPLSGTGFTGGGLNYPYGIAIDLNGNVWLANENNNYVSKFSSSGTPVSSTGYTGAGIRASQAIAVDTSNNIWVCGPAQPGISKLSNAGVAISGSSGYTAGGVSYAEAVAVDATGDVWSANTTGSLSKLLPNGSALSGSSGYTDSLSTPYALAVDAGGDVWTVDIDKNQAVEFNSGGSPVTAVAAPALAQPAALAIDGAGRIWIANINGNATTVLDHTGAVLSGSSGWASGYLHNAAGVAVDPSGNVWFGSQTTSSVTELVGAAAPVPTPLVAALAVNKLGTRP